MRTNRTVSRRGFLTGLAAGTATAILTACGNAGYPTPIPAGATPAPAGAATTVCCTPTAAPQGQQAPAQAPAGGSASLPTPRNQTVVVEAGAKLQIFDSFNPYIPNGEQTSAGINQGLRESMFYFDFPTNRLIPWLATKYEYSADFSQLTLSLDPKVTWNDGRPYTADDVIFTLDLLAKNPQFNGASQVATWVDSAAATDRATVAIRLKKPNPRFHYNFVAGITTDVIKVAPKHVWEGQDAGTFRNNPPVWTGPYVLDRTIPEQFAFVYKKNPNYWNRAVLDPKPPFLVFRQNLPADGSLQEFQRGNTDIPGGLDAILLQSIKGSYKNMIVVNAADVCPRGVWLNQESPSGLFQTAEGRRAISYLLDREAIAKTIWQPASRPAKYPWADWAANDKWVNPEIQKQYDLIYDPRRAEQLLDGLGATRSGATRQLNGKPLSLSCITPVEVGKPEYQIAQSLAENARRIGLDIQVKSLIGTTFNDAYTTGQYDLTSHWLCGAALDPNQLYSQFDEQYYQPLGTRATQGNSTRTRIPELTAITTRLANADPSDPANKALFDQGLDAFMKHLPALPVIQTIFPIAYNTTHWKGWPTEENLYNVPQWWWTQFMFVIAKLEPAGR